MAMLSDITPDEHDFPQCEHCGAPLANRFTPCPFCNARPLDSLGARSAPPPPLKIPLGDSESMFEPQLPVRKIWRPSSRALTDPYDVAEEPQLAAPVTQKLRRPLVLSMSAVVVTSAVYLGFIHTNDEEISPPIAVSGKVTTQNIKPPVSLAQRSAPVFAARRPRSPHPVRSPPIPPSIAAPPASRRVAVASSGSKHSAGSPPGNQTNNPPDKPRVDISKQLRAARANLQQNNLSATKRGSRRPSPHSRKTGTR